MLVDLYQENLHNEPIHLDVSSAEEPSSTQKEKKQPHNDSIFLTHTDVLKLLEQKLHKLLE